MDSLSLALGQISFAVSDLTKKNYKATLKEIHEVSFKRPLVFIVEAIYVICDEVMLNRWVHACVLIC